jgi:hypothetical protein
MVKPGMAIQLKRNSLDCGSLNTFKRTAKERINEIETAPTER